MYVLKYMKVHCIIKTFQRLKATAIRTLIIVKGIYVEDEFLWKFRESWGLIKEKDEAMRRL